MREQEANAFIERVEALSARYQTTVEHMKRTMPTSPLWMTHSGTLFALADLTRELSDDISKVEQSAT